MHDNHRWTWTTDEWLPSRIGAATDFMRRLLRELAAHQWDEQDRFGVLLSVEEAVVNAIRHGNRLDDDKRVHVRCRLSPERIFVQITDEGAGFSPADVPDCTAPENLHRPCGRGLMLMINFMTSVEFSEKGNKVTLQKERSC